MRIVYEYSHLGGREILQVRFPTVLEEIYAVIKEVSAVRGKKSKEKTKLGKELYAPKIINQRLKEAFHKRGFHELRDYYDIRLPGQEEPVVRGAYKQIDFFKERVLVEAQFGKYAFMFYDMAKFQYFFNETRADVGVEIVPAYALHKEMSSGVAYGEQLIYDIERLKRHFPAVPVHIILIDAG